MTSINNFVLKNFILDKVGNFLDLPEARKLGIDDVYNKVANELDVDDKIDIEDLLDSELYEQFATLYVTETEEKEETINKEKEKEERNKVQDTNGAGV